MARITDKKCSAMLRSTGNNSSVMLIVMLIAGKDHYPHENHSQEIVAIETKGNIPEFTASLLDPIPLVFLFVGVGFCSIYFVATVAILGKLHSDLKGGSICSVAIIYIMSYN